MGSWKVQMKVQFSFFWAKEKLFVYDDRHSRNFTMVSSRRRAKMCPVLKFNQGSHIFEGFPGTIFPLWSRKLH